MSLEADSILTGSVNLSEIPAGVTYEINDDDLRISARHFSITLILRNLFLFLFQLIVLLALIYGAIYLISMAGFAEMLNQPSAAEASSAEPNTGQEFLNFFYGIFDLPWVFLRILTALFGVAGALVFGVASIFLLCLWCVIGGINAIAGKTEVYITHGAAKVLVGIGPLGRRRRFQAAAVRDVRLAPKKRKTCDIVIETDSGRRIRFGRVLTDERRNFLAAVLHRALLE